jgi:hypothetical protein
MKTFFSVKFALLPLAVFFTLVAYGYPALAVGAGFVVALAVCCWRFYIGALKSLEIAVLAILAALAAAYAIRPDYIGVRTVPFVFIGLAVFALGSVALRKPWSAEFSRAHYPGAETNPLFLTINMILSGLWGVLFLLLALAHALSAGALVTTAIVVAGAIASIFGPGFLIRRMRGKG